MSREEIYLRIIGLILCLPFVYLLFACTVNQPVTLIIPCTVGAGTGFAIEVDAALAIGLYLIFTGGGKLIN
jgi:hypothetical protein